MKISKLNKSSVRTANPVGRITSLSEEALFKVGGGVADCVVVTETPGGSNGEWHFGQHGGYPTGS